MESYYSSASFVRLANAEGSTTRFVDIVKSPYVDGLKDPHLFSYYFLSENPKLDYSLPAEGFNHGDVLSLFDGDSGLSRGERLYYSNAFLPQIHSDQDILPNEVGSLLSITNQDGLYTNLYITVYPGEAIADIYEAGDYNNSFGLNDDQGGKTPTLMRTVKFPENSIDTLRAFVLGIDIVPSSWEYINPVVQNITRSTVSPFGEIKNSSDYYKIPQSKISETLDDSIYRVGNKNDLYIRDRKVSSNSENITRSEVGVPSDTDLYKPVGFIPVPTSYIQVVEVEPGINRITLTPLGKEDSGVIVEITYVGRTFESDDTIGIYSTETNDVKQITYNSSQTFSLSGNSTLVLTHYSESSSGPLATVTATVVGSNTNNFPGEIIQFLMAPAPIIPT
jgi:hypothetical protein